MLINEQLVINFIAKLRTGIKYIKKILFCLGALGIGYFLIAIILSIMSTTPDNLDCVPEKEVFIATNGVHLDIIVPRKILTRGLQQELEISESVEYLSFGWGDRAFYLETPTWNDLKLSTAVKAIFLNRETAIHLVSYYKKYDHWISIQMCEMQIALLFNYLDRSFKRDGEYRLIEIRDSGYAKYDKFYEANGNFSCLQTCNNWVNEGLKEAKIKTSIWSPFDYGVLYQVGKK
ncbi:MAG: DUF2459 domain-containing protein [Bacteroidetes bacterium]|nr:DUF2459 domain-containing protein [Bacteroidota bacterium]MDA1122216.1 DUF2459 domain-containing protein [Bacteroidota bacterium]